MCHKLTKQYLYGELLEPVLPLLRNRETWPWWRRLRTFEADTQLIHNIHVTLAEEEFTTWDVWFLNNNAKEYCEKAKGALLYDRQVSTIRRLFAALPDEMKAQVDWPGP